MSAGVGWGLLLQMKIDRQSDLRKRPGGGRRRNVNIWKKAFPRA